MTQVAAGHSHLDLGLTWISSVAKVTAIYILMFDCGAVSLASLSTL